MPKLKKKTKAKSSTKTVVQPYRPAAITTYSWNEEEPYRSIRFVPKTFPQLIRIFVDAALPSIPTVLRDICCGYIPTSKLFESEIYDFLRRSYQRSYGYASPIVDSNGKTYSYHAGISFKPYADSTVMLKRSLISKSVFFERMADIFGRYAAYFRSGDCLANLRKNFIQYFFTDDDDSTDDIEFYVDAAADLTTLSVRCPVLCALLQVRLEKYFSR